MPTDDLAPEPERVEFVDPEVDAEVEDEAAAVEADPVAVDDVPPFVPFVPPTSVDDTTESTEDYITEQIPVVLVAAMTEDGHPVRAWSPLPGGLLPGPAPFGVAHNS